jgi:hypothetical protein
MFPQDRDLRGKILRHPHVVAVEQRDQRGGRVAKTQVPGARNAAIRLVQDPHAWILVDVGTGDRERRVGRAVVDDDGLQIGEGLAQSRFDRGADVRLHVVRGHDYADGWHRAS